MISLTDRIIHNGRPVFLHPRKPLWLRARLVGGPVFQRLRAVVDQHQLHTVCESAKCPNMGECWSGGAATLMILGDTCTRSCGFCHIKTGRPPALDTDEPRRVGRAAAMMALRHIVVTSVNRDELPDGGAVIWAQTIRQIRAQSPVTSVETLVPDFCGNWRALQLVIDEQPEILNHNMETVRRLYPAVRPQAKYDRSIELLRRCKDQGLDTKTGIMVGIGETDEEIYELMHDLVVRASIDILTIGQYLQPSCVHLPIDRWISPEQFAGYRRVGERIGVHLVESGPLVRSSYRADQHARYLRESKSQRSA